MTGAVLFAALFFGKDAGARDHIAGSPAEIEQLSKIVRPGDTIIFRNGTWQEADILFDAEGTPESPITLRAETPGEVIIRGPSRLRIAGRHLVVDGLFFHQAYNDDHLVVFRRDSKRLARDCRLTNSAIVDCNTPDPANESRWIALYGERNRVDHCWIQGKATKGTTVAVFLSDEPNAHHIDHNHFGPRPDFGKNGGETIRIGDSGTSLASSRTLVEFNCFEECSGEAEIISNKSCDNVYRANTFLRAAGALTLRHGHRCRVEGNFFLGQRARGTGGVRVIGEGHRVVNNYFADLEGDDHRAALSIMNGLKNSPKAGYSPVRDVLIAFNTFVNCKQSIVVGLSDDDTRPDVPPADCTLANNLIASKRTAIDLRFEPVNFRWQGNLVSRSESLPGFPGIRPIDDVKLRKDSNGIWRPATASPAIGAAEGEFPSVGNDIDGQQRSRLLDVGCDQLSEGVPLRQPLFPTSVGPAWKKALPAD